MKVRPRVWQRARSRRSTPLHGELWLRICRLRSRPRWRICRSISSERLPSRSGESPDPACRLAAGTHSRHFWTGGAESLVLSWTRLADRGGHADPECRTAELRHFRSLPHAGPQPPSRARRQTLGASPLATAGTPLRSCRLPVPWQARGTPWGTLYHDGPCLPSRTRRPGKPIKSILHPSKSETNDEGWTHSFSASGACPPAPGVRLLHA